MFKQEIKKIKQFFGFASPEELAARNDARLARLENEQKKKKALLAEMNKGLAKNVSAYTSPVRREIEQINRMVETILARPNINEEDIAYLMLYLPLVVRLFDDHIKWRKNCKNNDVADLYAAIAANSMIVRMHALFKEKSDALRDMDADRKNADLGAIDALLKMKGK